MIGPKRLFWRIYINGLLLLISVALAVSALTLWLQPTLRGLGRAESLHRVLAIELRRSLDNTAELQGTLERLATALDRDAAIYTREGARLVAAGNHPPPALARKDFARIGDWHPLHLKEGGWVHSITLSDGSGPYLLIQGRSSGSGQLALSLAAVLGVVALVSWPLTRTLAAPLERLTANSRRLADGDLTARSGMKRGDEIGQLARALDDMAGRLEARIQREKTLFADLSHEIRTPLARLRVALELCVDMPGDPNQTLERLQGISVDLAELELLADNVLTTSRLDLVGAGTSGFPLRRREVNLTAFFDEIEARFHRHYPQRMLRLNLSGLAVNLSALWDDALLHRVCSNLLDNAIKHSPASVAIDLVAVVSGEPQVLLVEIVDQGEGVAEADMANLFTPFFRADRSRCRRTGGTGLGLTLCKRIIEAHDGAIAAKRNEKGGLIISFTVPFVIPIIDG